jgi:hypothetical protein
MFKTASYRAVLENLPLKLYITLVISWCFNREEETWQSMFSQFQLDLIKIL